MKQRLWCKAISVISALALLVSALGICNAAFAVSPDLDQLNLQAVVDESGIVVSNSTNADELEAELKKLTLPNGYTVDSITDFYKIEAIEGAIEKGSTYAGAPDSELLVPGVDGYVAAITAVKDASGNIFDASVVLKIDAPMYEYKFTTISKSAEFVIEGTTLKQYTGKAQKVVIPDNITTLADGWNVKNILCIVYGSGITTIPQQTPNSRVNVVKFKGAVTEISDKAFQNWKYLKHIHLPETLVSIGNDVFRGTIINNFVLPESLKNIGSHVLNDPTTDTSGHMFTEIKIPANVKTIASEAFYGPASECSIEILSDSEGIARDALYYTKMDPEDEDFDENKNTINEAKEPYGSKNILRVVKGSYADKNINCAAGKKAYLDDMSLAEALARAYCCKDNLEEITASSASDAKISAKTIEEKIRASFGNVPTVTTDWNKVKWSKQGSEYVNALLLSKDEKTATIQFALPEAGVYDLQTLVDQKGITVSNTTTKSQLFGKVSGIELTDGFTVDSIIDFYKIEAIEGAVERGSTYPGAVDGEVLVPGVKGAISATFELRSPDNKLYQSTVNFVIEPTMATYRFTSCSTEADFTYNSADWARRWEYKPKNLSGYEKLVIPDKVTELKEGWHGDNYSASSKAKCIVYNSNITSIPAQYNFHSVQVVSFKGDVTEICGNNTNAAFKDCTQLKYILLPDTVKSLGQKVFYNCTSLTNLYLPEGLESIGSNIFFDVNDGSHNGHNLTNITIPASVKKIGKFTFTDAKKPCTITVFTKDAEINNEGFCRQSGANSSNITLRVFSGSTAASDDVYANKKVLLEDTMTVAEASARAMNTVLSFEDRLYSNTDELIFDSENLLEEIESTYGYASSITAEFKNEDWTRNGNFFENSVILSQGSKKSELKIKTGVAENFDLQSYVDASGLTFTNDTGSKLILKNELDKVSLPAGYTVESVSEFYKVAAIDGAVEEGSTYKGAVDGEVLVQGEKGFITATVFVRNAENKRLVASLMLTVEPKIEKFAFASCSSDKDWSYNAEGWAQMWEYHPVAGVAAEKIVIPDKITELKGDWHQAWNPAYDTKNMVRCIVFNEHITYLPPMYNFYSLQVVSIRGNVTELGTDANNGVFKDCFALRYVRLPDSIKVIGDRAFESCTALTNLYLPEGLETIKNYMFFENGQSYGIPEITIPSTVKSIGRMSFMGAAVPTTITCLSEAPQASSNGIHANAFSHSTYASASSRIKLRVIEGSGAASDATLIGSGNKVLMQDDMGYVEAAARAWQKSTKMTVTETTVDELEKQLMTSYGKVTGTFTTYWEKTVWDKKGDVYSNNFVISKNGARFLIPIKSKLIFTDAQKAVDDCKLTCDNFVTEKSFEEEFKNSIPGAYTLQSLDQFYKIDAISGAVDVTDGKNEVLVPGHSGNIRAIATLIRADGKIETVYVDRKIEPKMDEYTFKSVSSAGDFVIEGNVLKKYTGTAEKVVIPEGVTTLDEKWLSGIKSKASDYDGVDSTIKCIVYPESLEGKIPAQTNLISLRAVSFKGTKVTEFGEKAFFKATNLEHIDLPADLKTIGNMALACGANGTNTKLDAIYLPDGLETIGDYAFYWQNNDRTDVARQGIKEITIPASVKSIGKYAFAYPLVTDSERDVFTVTFLNKDAAYAENMLANEIGGAKIVVRAFSTSGVYQTLAVNPDYTVEDLDGMTLVEAAARATVKAEQFARKMYETTISPAEVAAALKEAFANKSGISDSWGDTWDTTTDAKRYGTLSLSDGTYSVGVNVDIDVPPVITLGQLVDSVIASSKLATITNSDGIEEYKAAVEENIIGKYKIEILDYNIQRAMDGAEDNTGILVPGENGCVAATVKVMDYYGNSKNILITSKVVPTIEYYTFESVTQPEDLVLSEDGTLLLEYYGTAEKLVVPDGVEKIADGWMWKNPSCIKALILPDSIKDIPDYACEGMSSVEIVTMGDNVVNIGASAFSGCYSLKYLHFSENLEEVKDSAFAYTYSLTDARIPTSVTRIGSKAFYCSGIRNVTIPEDTFYIGENAFAQILGDASLIGNTYFPIAGSVKENVIANVSANKVNSDPLMITVFGKDTIVFDSSFENTYKQSPEYIVRSESGSTVCELINKKLSAGGTAVERWQNVALDMSLVEAAARANVKADSLVLYNKESTVENITKMITNSFLSSAVSESNSWNPSLSINLASGIKNGSATGTLQFADASGDYTFSAPVNATVYNVRPELYTSDDEDFNWDDEDEEEDEDWDDEDEDDEDEEDDWDDEDEEDDWDDEDEDEDDEDDWDEDEDEDEESTSSKKYKKVIRRSNGDEFPWWIVIVAGAVVVAVGVFLLIFFLAKKKKKNNN